MTALPVVVPFITAAVLVILRPLTRRWVNDAVSLAGVAAVIVLCAILLDRSAQRPFAYWMGGIEPIHDVTIGISLSIDPLGAGLASFSAVLLFAALAYSARYFDAVDGLFHALMLLFGAAMVGFTLTGDLFNLIVFFELMGAAAYALTGYLIEERAPIQGAINFAVTNSIAGYAMFIGVALLYARTGALNMAQIGLALDRHGADPLVVVAMTLLFAGFLTKAAAVPLHFWLADAHAVAPVPVCVLFSGIMVELGVYAVARLYWVVFAGPMHPHVEALRAILVAIGVVTALLAALMCFQQRHIKRMLAFSSIAHIGVFICGIGLLSAKALAGVAVYVVGQGLTKGALFMGTGVLLHRFRTIDEYDLHGRGREIPVVGVLLAVGALLLAALPPFTLFAGKSLLEESASAAGYGWLIAVFVIAAATTGAAVLRVTGRVFLGWGPADAPDAGQERAARVTEEEMQDRPDHTPPMMVVVPTLLLVLALAVALIPGAVPAIEQAAAHFTDHAAYAHWVLRGQAVHWPSVAPSHISAQDVFYSAGSVLGAVALAAFGLFGRPLRRRVPEALSAPWLRALHTLRDLHSGHIGDYIAWWTAGTSLLGAICLLTLA
ncbi:MAG TPA: proton-conducting transporter membrane subunit [Solirubrobacteraceae bacterium]|nr:proton-conducting transporter membrane subunit [Solirubrobacteraceae bacterium]